MKNLYLIGFMGCGKSTVSAALCHQYGGDRVEMDVMLEQEAGMSIPTIFELYGEAHFRKLERALLQRIAAQTGQIVSCGGGVITNPENIALMRASGTVVWLQATPETIFARIGENENRPLLKGRRSPEGIQALLEQRRPLYEAAADLCLVTDGKTPEELCTELHNLLHNQ